ncbi:MAG TPA: hypothetical protein VGN37_04210 [Actinocatenispora sp.]
MRVRRLLGATLAVSALVIGAGSSLASADVTPKVTTYQPTGAYQFASNYKNGAVWQVGGTPLSQPDSAETVGSTGVTLSTKPAAGEYADAGVIVPVGSVGDLFDADGVYQGIQVDGPGAAATETNLYIDTNADGHYLSFSADGFYVGPAGDQVLYDVDATLTRDKVEAGAHGARAAVWAWVGVSGTGTKSATITGVGGTTLVKTVDDPSVLAPANVCRLSSSTAQNLWTVTNTAGGRSRDFHFGVNYGGKTTWTGVHTVAAGKTFGIVTKGGGKAIVQWYDGYGVAKEAYAYSDHTKYCAS